MPAGDEIMMPATKADAIEFSHIQALRQVSDTLAIQGRAMDALARSVERQTEHTADVRERLIRIEAQETTKRIEEVEAVSAASRDKLDYRIDAACERVSKLELAQARYQGLFMPLSIMGAALSTGAISLILQKVFGHG